MAYLKPERPEKVTAPSLKASKERGERLACLTAYDYPIAKIVGEAGIDIILVDEEIAVMGHIGLTPQSVNKLGGYRVQGKTAAAARKLLDDAYALEAAGAFSIVLELVPREIAQLITEEIGIPTIGIGAGPHC